MKTADRAEISHYKVPQYKTTCDATLVFANLSTLETGI